MSDWMNEKLKTRSVQIGLGVLSGAAFALLAYLLMGLPEGPPPLFPHQDKLLHFVAFAGVTAPAALALPGRYLLFWVAHMSLVAVGTEFFQGLVYAERTASPWDALADLLGIGLALAVCVPVRRVVLSRATA